MRDLLDVVNSDTASGEELREHARQTGKKFKTSWVDLARVLFTVYKDKLYRVWGYEKFDNYVTKEIGIRKLTALKLLRSYGFLEREEPVYLKPEYATNSDTDKIPGYEAIDVLRQAKSKKQIDSREYADLREKVFLKGKDAVEVRKDLTTLMRQRQEDSPEEAWQKRKEATVKRFISTLKSLKREMQETKMVQGPVLEDIGDLIDRLEVEMQ